MPLNATQLKFLQNHVLRRRMMSALDLAGANTPSAADLVTGRRAGAQQLQAMLATLRKPPRAALDEAARIDALRDAITRNLSGHLTDADIDEAEASLRALDAEILDCERRIGERDDAVRLRKASLLSEQDAALKTLSGTPLAADGLKITEHTQRIAALTAAALPASDALDQADAALALLQQAVRDANAALVADRQRRGQARQQLLGQLATAKLSDEATDQETEQARALAETVTTLLVADAPGDDALARAEEPLARFKAFTAKVNEEISSVRKVRFARAGEVAKLLAGLSIALPAQCPEGAKAGLVEAHTALGSDLQPFLDWAKVTSWEPAALEAVAERIAAVDGQFKALRLKLAEAIEAIRLAAEAAGLAIASPKGHAFSVQQKGHFEAMLELAVTGAKADVLAAAPQLEKLKALGRQAEAVSRVRNELLRRLGLLPLPAPLGASSAERKRWTDLRAAAVRAADEMTEA